MRVAIAQMNSSLGSFSENRQTILRLAKRAQSQGADLVVFPECALYGYPPKDTLESDRYVERQLKEAQKLATQWKGDAVLIFGLITRNPRVSGKPFYNSAAVLRKGKMRFFNKSLLPSYDVFDEARYVEPGQMKSPYIKIKGKTLAITICEDIWGWRRGERSEYPNNPLQSLDRDKVDCVVNISASPFSKGQVDRREFFCKKTAEYFKSDVVYCNMWGGQDELIFDGSSFIVNSRGVVTGRANSFDEDLLVQDLCASNSVEKVARSEEEWLLRALTLGIRDFCAKTGLKRVHLGLSGGIDSALVAALACRAVGAENVTALAMPTRYNSQESLSLARDLAKRLNMNMIEVEIDETYRGLVQLLSAPLGLSEMSVTHENLQSRLRGLILMAFANAKGSLLLTTGNKSEYATGYATLYGDMCGGLAPIADLVKREVFQLAEYLNREEEIIPRRIITRPPSAELRPDQVDEESLPPYEKLDAAVENVVESKQPARNKVERFVADALLKTEFKRWQAPPVLRVSQHAFGRGRRFPIANGGGR